MSKKDDKWMMFRNFMYNELGITKEDIRTWITDAVNERVDEIIRGSFGRFDMDDLINKSTMSIIRKSLDNYDFEKKIKDKIIESITFRDSK